MGKPSEKEIGQRLHRLRTNKNLSVQQLADICKVTRQSYWMYEHGQRNPSDEVKLRIADFYNESVDSIFFT